MIPDSRLHDLLRQQGHDPGFERPVDRPKRKRDNREHRIQAAIVAWFRSAAAGLGVDPRLLFAIPNGALYGRGVERVIRAKMLKAEGLTPGVPDLFLARASYCDGEAEPYELGMFVECKTPEGAIAAEQKAMHELLRARGYRVEVVRSVEEGIAVITSYLKT